MMGNKIDVTASVDGGKTWHPSSGGFLLKPEGIEIVPPPNQEDVLRGYNRDKFADLINLAAKEITKKHSDMMMDLISKHLGRPATIEDAKRCQKIHREHYEPGEYDFAVDGIILGTFKNSPFPTSPPWEMKVTFTPFKKP